MRKLLLAALLAIFTLPALAETPKPLTEFQQWRQMFNEHKGAWGEADAHTVYAKGSRFLSWVETLSQNDLLAMEEGDYNTMKRSLSDLSQAVYNAMNGKPGAAADNLRQLAARINKVNLTIAKAEQAKREREKSSEKAAERAKEIDDRYGAR
ncbi:hypothetical protein ACFQDM_04705 [Ponticaulis profundi]|uniref:Uncharacterized protein n=2 Tax=Ponticaulis profundi TaxID=2665222 RepID=A0ABW1S7F6_9PROT